MRTFVRDLSMTARASSLPNDDQDLRYAASMPSLHDAEAPRPFCGGMWKTRQLVGFILGVASLYTCYFVRVIPYYTAANDMMGICLLCAFFWMFEVVPIYITALVPMVLIPWFKITSADIIIAAYWDKVSMLFLGTFIVDVAMEHVGLPRRMALYLLLKAGGSARPSVLLALLMGLTWVFSMVCNSIATTLMLCPMVVSLMNAAEESDHESSSSEQESADGDEYIPKGARNLQQVADGFMIGIAYSASIGGMATLIGTPVNLIFAGDPLVNGQVSFFHWFKFAVPISFCLVVIAYVIVVLRYMVRNPTALGRHLLEEEYERLVNEAGFLSRDEVLVGLVQIILVVMLFTRRTIGQTFVANSEGVDLMNGGCLAVAAAGSVFFLPSSVHRGQAILTWKDVQEKVQWGVLLMIGGGRALGCGFTQSGLDMWLGDVFDDMVRGGQSLTYTFVISLISSLVAHVFTPTIAAAIVLPVFACTSMIAIIHPLELMLPATLACSFAFMLPTSSATGIITFAKSCDLYRPLRIRDFLSNGVPLWAASVILSTLLSWKLGTIFFGIDSPYPEWACNENNAAACKWIYAPGIVRGHQVESQACMYLDDTNDTMCRIWNGTTLNALAGTTDPYQW